MQKVAFFETNYPEYKFNFVSFCEHGQPKLSIGNRDHFQTYFNDTTLMIVLDLINEIWLKFTVFEVSPNIFGIKSFDLVNFSILNFVVAIIF